MRTWSVAAIYLTSRFAPQLCPFRRLAHDADAAVYQLDRVAFIASKLSSHRVPNRPNDSGVSGAAVLGVISPKHFLWEVLCWPANVDPGRSEFIREEAGASAGFVSTKILPSRMKWSAPPVGPTVRHELEMIPTCERYLPAMRHRKKVPYSC